MGGDGGVIATQRAFARGVGKSDEAKRDNKNIRDEQTARATTCALTNEILQSPLVSCELGNIFNKEAILTALIEKRVPDELSHIRGLKDIKTLEFATAITKDGRNIRVCPITQDEFNGSCPFVVIWSTGKVLSEKAIREIGIDGLQEEYGPFTSADFVKLIPVEQEMDRARAAMHNRREAKKAGKKSKASAAGETQTEGGEIESKGSKKRSIAEANGEEDGNIPDKRTSVSSNVTPAVINSKDSLVRKAAVNVEQNSKQSQVYKSLFHKDGEKDKKDRDLFMSVAGLRYTIN
jgi:hypothetical protein